jgi:predicted Rossmann-fold nucleotide-binding protein
LSGGDFWDPLVAFLTTQTHAGAMADCTTSHFYVADSPTDAVDHIRDVAVGRFGLSYAPGRRRRPRRAR